jgi:ectoine hydroxylase-related dioxygenase (phytanoyl-CoA dioxygenase family)
MIKRRQLTEFYDRGFTVVADVFSRLEVREMLEAFDRLERKANELGESCMYRGSQFVVDKNGHDRVAIKRIVWCGAVEPVLSRYGQDPRLLKMAALLLGSWEMNQLINQAHFKLPGDGVEFPWHQDSTHRRYGGAEWNDVNGRGSYVQSVIALDEVTEANGPLEMIPGSCKLGHLEPGSNGQLPAAAIDHSRAVPLTMKPGSVGLFGPYTLHRSLVNGTDRPRRIFINGFSYPGANHRVYPGDGAGRMVRLSRS